MDEILVDKASSCSAVQEGFDGVEFTCVRSSDFHWQEQGGSYKGTPLFLPLNSMTTLWSYLSLFTSDT